MSSSSSSRRVGEELVAAGKWLALSKLLYRHPRTGEPRAWESVSRTTDEDPRARIADLRSNVAVMLATLADGKDGAKSILLVKQYRPSVDALSIEMPAGLIDRGESAKEAAIRELDEETGFTGAVECVSGPVANDPGLTNCGMQVVQVHIRGGRDEKRMSESDKEVVETIVTPISGLSAYLDEQIRSGVVVDSRLYHFALGVCFSSS